ncbi:MAG: cytochrome c-type biogenesis protein CcmH [Nitrospiria bacterium]
MKEYKSAFFFRWFPAFLLTLFVFANMACTPGIAGTPAMSEDELQEKTKEVSKTLRCMVCQSESVWESSAQLAVEMREMVREKLLAGETPEQIRGYFVGRYGDAILLKPRKFVGLNLLLWGGPLLFLIGGLFLLYRNLVKWTGIKAPIQPEDSAELTEEEKSLIQKELNSFKK